MFNLHKNCKCNHKCNHSKNVYSLLYLKEKYAAPEFKQWLDGFMQVHTAVMLDGKFYGVDTECVTCDEIWPCRSYRMARNMSSYIDKTIEKFQKEIDRLEWDELVNEDDEEAGN